MNEIFTPSTVTKDFFVDSVVPSKRGTTISASDFLPNVAAIPGIENVELHDANFAFLSTTLAKLHKELVEPIAHTTYQDDIYIDVGGGFVDYISYFVVDWAGVMNEFRNAMGNNANYIPRVNAGMSQKKANVYTFEVAYDLRFVELEKMKKLQLQKSIKDIYSDIIVVGFDFFCEKICYTGIQGQTGLFNDPNVSVTTIDNSSTTGQGFEGLSDSAFVSWLNGMFEYYLLNSNMNPAVVPDTILVPTFVGADLSGRYNTLYTNTLRQFVLDHNLGKDEVKKMNITIASRPVLNDMGVAHKGRIVVMKKDKRFERMDMPYPMQHFLTMPNINQMSYTSAFVGQVSQVQLMYNTNPTELGPVSYWDFTN